MIYPEPLSDIKLDNQIQLLKEAKDYMEKQKWELISQKMVELGGKKKIPASTCEKKWKEIAPQQPQIPQTSPSLQTQEIKHEIKRDIKQEIKRELSHSSDEDY